MSIFGALVRTVVNVATLPVVVAVDVVTALPDALRSTENIGDGIGHRTREKLREIKDEAEP